MFSDDKYIYQSYMPLGFSNPQQPPQRGRPIDPAKFPSQNAQTLAAGVAALSRVTMYVSNQYAAPYAVRERVKGLRKQIDAVMPSTGGVLVVVRKKVDPDTGQVQIDNAWVGAAAEEPGAAFRTYCVTPQILPMFPRGYQADFEFYWVTTSAEWRAINTSA